MNSKNTSDKQPVGVIGAGSFGIALANLLAENQPVLVFSRRPESVEKYNSERRAAGQNLQDGITLTSSLEEVANSCFLIFPVVPSVSFQDMMRQLAPFLRPDHILIHATKGLFVDLPDEGSLDSLDNVSSLRREQVVSMSELIDRLSVVVKIGCLAGPNLARELSDGLPAATVVGSRFDEVINLGKAVLRSPRFQVYGSYDIHGIELAGVMKNILALASGIVRGMGLGENARSLLITRGLTEIIALGKVLEIDARAFLGLAGIGDIIATCSSPLSRNYTVGYRLAKGEKLEEIIESMDEVAEGVRTVKIANALAREYKLSVPIISVLFQILFEDLEPNVAVSRLMMYRRNFDVDFI